MIGGILFLIFGAIITRFAGLLLIDCADKIGSDKYEDFAEACYGPKIKKVISWVNVVTLLGFVMGYIVAVKTLIP